jgi:hypothetical protein
MHDMQACIRHLHRYSCCIHGCAHTYSASNSWIASGLSFLSRHHIISQDLFGIPTATVHTTQGYTQGTRRIYKGTRRVYGPEHKLQSRQRATQGSQLIQANEADQTNPGPRCRPSRQLHAPGPDKADKSDKSKSNSAHFAHIHVMMMMMMIQV